MDRLTTLERSDNMRRIRSKNTQPEIAVRRLIHGLGYRFRLHKKGLPGTPDLVLPRFRKAVFVHGCFWHQHTGCKYKYVPKSRRHFWLKKLTGNKQRDYRDRIALRKLGWQPIVIWECELRDLKKLHARVAYFLKHDIRS